MNGFTKLTRKINNDLLKFIIVFLSLIISIISSFLLCNKIRKKKNNYSIKHTSNFGIYPIQNMDLHFRPK